nr:hypothetical protein [Mycoplasmopsis bovis]
MCLFQNAVNRDLEVFTIETSFMSELFKKVEFIWIIITRLLCKKLVEHIQIYHNFMLDRINEFKGKVQIIDEHT